MSDLRTRVRAALLSVALHDGWAEHEGADLDRATDAVLSAMHREDDGTEVVKA